MAQVTADKGTKFVGFHADEDLWMELKIVSTRLNMSMKDALTEATSNWIDTKKAVIDSMEEDESDIPFEPSDPITKEEEEELLRHGDNLIEFEES